MEAVKKKLKYPLVKALGACPHLGINLNGARHRSRTRNPLITNEMHCQLC